MPTADSGMLLEAPTIAIGTACVYFQRFYVFQSFKEFPMWSMLACCFLLAAKVEETMRHLFDIIRVLHRIRFGSSTAPLQEDSREYRELKEETLVNERILLQTLGFDLSIEHPYARILRHAKTIPLARDLVQNAWTLCNDYYGTTLCLQYGPETIGCAMILLASKLLGTPLPEKPDAPKWWADEDGTVTEHDMEGASCAAGPTAPSDVGPHAARRPQSCAARFSICTRPRT